MTGVLTRAMCFVAIIAIGMILRRVRFFKAEDFSVLPAAVNSISILCSITIVVALLLMLEKQIDEQSKAAPVGAAFSMYLICRIRSAPA